MPRIAHASPQSCRGFLNDCLHDSGQPLRYTPSINARVHNVGVPFTLAHSAAALPLRRLRLVLSALVIGTFAPDFEYFLHFSPSGRFGHTLLGSLVLTLPLALLVLWIFHAIVKIPVIHLLPNAIQRRLHDHVYEFRFRGVSRSLLIVVSVLLGIATHLVWDAFTHSHTWPYHHWSVLRQQLQFPILGQIPCYKALQHASSIIGTGVLAAWFMHWYRTTEPSQRLLGESLPLARKGKIIATVTTVALLGAIARALAGIGTPTNHLILRRFVGQAVVTAIALVWWQLVAYGLFFRPEGIVEPRQL